VAKRLQVFLLPNWARADNPDGPVTLYRTDSDDSGALQVSPYAEYNACKVPNTLADDLVGFAQRYGQRRDAGELVGTLSGACILGKFGAAVFRSTEYPRFQVWVLSNRRGFVLATHICTVEPEAAEVSEAQEIVGMLMLSRQTRPPQPGAGRDRGGIRRSRGSSSRRRRDR
jgi:hypothetical protein